MKFYFNIPKIIKKNVSCIKKFENCFITTKSFFKRIQATYINRILKLIVIHHTRNFKTIL